MNPKREVVESLRVFALRPQVLHSQSSHSQVNVRSSALMKGTAGLTRPTTHKTAVLRVEGGPYGPTTCSSLFAGVVSDPILVWRFVDSLFLQNCG